MAEDEVLACLTSLYMNCTAVAPVAAAIMQNVTADYLEVYGVYREHECSNTTSIGEALNAYIYWAKHIKQGTITALVTAVNDQCHEEFCQALPFPGNPDFAGVGVLASFGIQLSIATLFFLLYAYSLWQPNTTAVSKEQVHRVFIMFITSCIYFDIGLAIAVPVTTVSTKNSEYTARIASLGFVIALASTMALYPLYNKRPRRAQSTNANTTNTSNDATSNDATSNDASSTDRTGVQLENQATHTNKTRPSLTQSNGIVSHDGRPSGASHHQIWHERVLGLGVLLTSIILLAMLVYTRPQNVSWDSNFEGYCFHRTRSRPIAGAISYVPLALVALGLFFVVGYHLHRKIRTCLDQTSKWLLPSVATLGFIMMWASFAIMFILRRETAVLTGPSYQENQWGFGQVLAVVAWLPTLVQVVLELTLYGQKPISSAWGWIGKQVTKVGGWRRN